MKEFFDIIIKCFNSDILQKFDIINFSNFKNNKI